MVVQESVLSSSGEASQLKECIQVYGELTTQLMSSLSSLLKLGDLLGKLASSINNKGDINITVKPCMGSQLDLSSPLMEKKIEAFNESEMNIMNESNVNDINNQDIDFIRFTNNGPIFQISKQLIESIPYSYIYEQSLSELRTNDGTIFLGYDGNDAFIYCFMDYLNGKEINFSKYSFDEKLEFIDLIEFCNLSLPVELIECRERRDNHMKQYKKGDKVDLEVNGSCDDSISDYLKEHNLWEKYIMNYDDGYIYKYIPSKTVIGSMVVSCSRRNDYISVDYKYENYINKYIYDGYLELEEKQINSINKDIFINEFQSIFGEKGKEIATDAITPFQCFHRSTVLTRKSYETALLKWLGTDKQWKIIYKCCDDMGETVTIIKQRGHNGQFNIFGGYTDQDWDKSGGFKPHSKEFLFTLSNEHNIPPTRYGYGARNKNKGIYCDVSYGPCFSSDIMIGDHCDEYYSSSCEAKSYKEVNTSQRNALFVNTKNEYTSNTFIIDEYEVWGRC
ncbi:hypothetical protein WA158_005738 [Blastocystis sp. Blastoise]